MQQSEKYWQDKKDFLKIYSDNFLPYLNQCGKEIKYALNKKIFSRILCGFLLCYGIALGLFSFFLFMINSDLANIFYFFFCCSFFALVLWNNYTVKKSRKIMSNLKIQIKNNLMGKLCGCFENLRWLNGKYHDFESINLNILFSHIYSSIVKVGDVFSASLDNLKFDIVQLYTDEEQLNNCRPLFKSGIYIKIKTDKKFNSNIYIVPKSQREKKNNLYDNTVFCDGNINFFKSLSLSIYKKINILMGKIYKLDLKEINLLENNPYFTNFENVSFQNKFEVYTNNSAETRCIITSSFMEKILEIENKYNSKIKRIEFSSGDEILIFLETKSNDSFELFSPNKKISNQDVCFEAYNKIASVYDLAQYIKTNFLFETRAQKQYSDLEISEMTDQFNKIITAHGKILKLLCSISGVNFLCMFAVIFTIFLCAFLWDYLFVIIPITIICVVLFIVSKIFSDFLSSTLKRYNKLLENYNRIFNI